MITEDYISFETAKLLKEKGFAEPIGTAYWKNGEEIGLSNPVDELAQQSHNIIFRPTLQMAMKWLREVHNWHFYIRITSDSKYCFVFQRTNGNYYTSSEFDAKYDTYEQACNAAIKYCLENLI